MARRLEMEDLENRIACYGEFDRDDDICLVHCSLNFECAAHREHLFSQEWQDHSMNSLSCPHQA